MKNGILIKTLAIMLVYVFMFTLTACETSATPANEQKKDPGTEAATAEGGELAIVPPGMVSPFYTGIISGAKRTAQKLGHKCTVLTPEKESDFAGQVKIVEDLITKGVKGIALCSMNAEAISTAVKKANEANIPVVIFNSLVDLPSGDVSAYIGYDQAAGGAKCAEYVNRVENGKANVAIIEGLLSSFTIERKGGFEEKIKEYPGIEVIASQPGDWEREKSMNVAINMLQVNPDIDVFFGLSDEMGLGAAQACKAAGKTGVITISIDGNPNAFEAIKKGEHTATLYVMPDQIGVKAIEALDKIIRGEKVDKKIVTDTVIVDASNVDQYIK
jgi:ribose transport system substrate-binding protein